MAPICHYPNLNIILLLLLELDIILKYGTCDPYILSLSNFFFDYINPLWEFIIY